MATRTYLLPQVDVQQDFAALPATATQDLIAVIVGPQKNIKDVTDPNDSAFTNYGNFIATGNTAYALQGLGALDVVDPLSLDVLVSNFLASYAHLTTGINLGTAQNSLTLASGGYVKYLNADGTTEYARNGAFNLRDVQVGDGVIVTVGGAVVTKSKITSLSRAVNAASAGSFTSDINNLYSAGSHTATTVNAHSTNHAVVVDSTSAYHGNLASGLISDVYTITVSAGGTGAAATLSVASVNGDNVTSVASAAEGTAIAIGLDGLVVHFTGTGDYVTGETYTVAVTAAFTAQTPALITSGSDYVGLYNTVYEIQVVKGGTWAQGPQVAVTTNNGVDSSVPQIISGTSTAFYLGSLGLTANFTGDTNLGLRFGDIFYVAVTAVSPGAATTVILADPLPSTVNSGTSITVDFCYSGTSLDLPRAGYPTPGDTAWTISSDSKTVTLDSAIYTSNSAFLDSNSAPLKMPILSGSVSIGYQALVIDSANQLNSISDAGLIVAQLGKNVPANPLAYAVGKALENSAGVEVFYVSLSEDSLDGYNAALEVTLAEPSAYYFAPLTNDITVIEAVEAHVLAASDPTISRERIAFVNTPFSTIVLEYDQMSNGTSWSGYVSVDPTSSPSAYTLATVPGATFIADGIRAGDYFRSSFTVDGLGNDVYVAVEIQSVTDEQNLVLVAPGFSGAVGSSSSTRRIQIARNLSKGEQASAIAAASTAIGNRRVVNVWPDVVRDGSLTVAGYFVAAALAGLKSSVAPHQPLTNVVLNGFTAADHSTPYFSLSQLNTIAGGGTWIVDQASGGGALFTRHQLTTDYTDDNTAEISITTNLDSVSKFLRSDLLAYIGKYNNNPYFIQLLGTRFTDRLTYLMGYAATITAGPQVLGFTINSLAVDPLIRTKVNANINLTLPYPVNNINLQLNVI